MGLHKKMREYRGLTQDNMLPALKLTEPRMTREDISRGENGVMLFTPPVDAAYAYLVQAGTNTLYEPEEVNFGCARADKRKRTENPELRRVGARAKRELLDEDAPWEFKLEYLGYASHKAWQDHYIKVTNRRFRRLWKRAKKKPVAAATTTGEGRNTSLSNHLQDTSKEEGCQDV